MKNKLKGRMEVMKRNIVAYGNVVYVKGWFVMADYIITVDGNAVKEIVINDTAAQLDLRKYAYDFARDNCISAKGVKIIRKQS